MFLLFINSYRKHFLDDPANSGLDWEDGTIYFYFSIIAIIFFLGYVIERRNRRINRAIELKPLFILIGLILTCVLGLRGQNVGKDTIVYIQSASDNLTYIWDGSGMEVGFMYVNKFLGWFFSNGQISIFIFSFLTVYFILVSLWHNKSIINIFFALGFFVGVYYFQALNLLRIYLAASFITWGFHYIIMGKMKKYILCVLFAALFHLSSIVMLLPLAYYVLYKKSPWMAFSVLCIAVFMVVSVASHFSDYLVIQRYADYGGKNDYEGGFGIMLLVDYLPGLFLVWYIWKHKITGIWADMLTCFTLVAVFIRSIAYYIVIAGRLNTHFMVLYLILIPYFLNEMKTNHRKEYYPFVFFLFIFLLFKIDLYFNEYLATDGIIPYYFLWND